MVFGKVNSVCVDPSTLSNLLNFGAKLEKYRPEVMLYQSGFKLSPDSREKRLLPPGKLGRKDSQIGRSYRVNYGIFCQLRSKLAITLILLPLNGKRIQCSGSRLSPQLTCGDRIVTKVVKE